MSDAQHTLFLWIRGAFPRRIAYQLLQKGICSSVADLHAGKTIAPSFRINPSVFNLKPSGDMSMDELDGSDPKPAGKSSPALRVRDKDGRETWLCESITIALYIEELFPSYKSLVSGSVLGMMRAVDMITLINLLGVDFGYYLRHAAPITSFWSHLADEDRSLGAARNALFGFNRSLVKLQDWCAPVLAETGFLTPDVEGPGVVDFALAGNMRYLELGYEFNSLEDERLDKLREWWVRFKKECWWWAELEEVDDVHPPQLRFAKEVREV